MTAPPPALSTLRLLVSGLLLLVAPSVFAQQQTTISGRVVDEDGVGIPNVTVTITRTDRPDDPPRGGLTDLDGEFRFVVEPGTYRVTADALGFSSETKETNARAGVDTALLFKFGAAVIPPRPAVTPTRYFDLYEDNLFLVGPDDFLEQVEDRDPMEYSNQFKFRASFRYKVVDWSRCERCGSGLSVTYTQNSFWHFYDDSAPFFDNNYSPGALVYHDLAEGRQPDPSAPDAPQTRDNRFPAVYAGVFHESNGREVPFSRGWNRWALGASWGAVNRTPVSGSLTLWRPFGVEETNADLVDFAGRGVAEVYAHPLFESHEDPGPLTIQVRSRVLGRTLATNLEANATYHLGRGTRWFTPAITAQLFTGYAENLLTYDETRTVVRFGISVMR